MNNKNTMNNRSTKNNEKAENNEKVRLECCSDTTQSHGAKDNEREGLKCCLKQHKPSHCTGNNNTGICEHPKVSISSLGSSKISGRCTRGGEGVSSSESGRGGGK